MFGADVGLPGFDARGHRVLCEPGGVILGDGFDGEVRKFGHRSVVRLVAKVPSHVAWERHRRRPDDGGAWCVEGGGLGRLAWVSLLFVCGLVVIVFWFRVVPPFDRSGHRAAGQAFEHGAIAAGAAGEIKEEFMIDCAKVGGLHVRIEIGTMFFVHDVDRRIVYGLGVGHGRVDCGRYGLVDRFQLVELCPFVKAGELRSFSGGHVQKEQLPLSDREES